MLKVLLTVVFCLSSFACSDGGETAVDALVEPADDALDAGDDSSNSSPDSIFCGSTGLDALPIQSGVEVTGTVGGPSQTEPVVRTCAGSAGPEAVYYVETDRPADLTWDITPDFDGVAYIRSECDGLDDRGGTIAELACSDAEPDLGFETAEVLDAPPGVYFLFVDGFESGDEGRYSALFRLREIGVEGDDCDPEVVLSRCVDGLGCNPVTNTCTRENVCEDLADNDGDGLIDCEDPDDCKDSDVCSPGDGPVGSPCSHPSDCSASGNDPFCWSEEQGGYPSGYCSEFCPLTGNGCPDGAACIDLNLPSRNGLCFDRCGTDDDCPTDGYACSRVRDTTLCLPACRSDEQCLSTGFCNEDSGSCAVEDEACDDRIDNDDDDRADCDDLDCRNDEACVEAVAAACTDAGTAESTTRGDTATGTQTLAGSCVGAGGLEQALTYVPGEPDQHGFLVLGLESETDQGLYVRTDCESAMSEIGCADAGPGGTNESLAVAVEGGTPVSIIVDGFEGASQAGPYTLLIAFVESAEVEPNGSIDTATEFVEDAAAQISPSEDRDFFLVTVHESGSTIDAEVSGLGRECDLATIDPEVEILDSEGTSLAFNDDIAQRNLCSRARATGLEPGDYTVRVSSSQEFNPFATFPYLLEVSVIH